jgi:hypothetical protein
MDLQSQIIELIKEVAELKAQVAILWKVFVGVTGILAVDVVTRFVKTFRKREKPS